jgi:hypothetical protein
MNVSKVFINAYRYDFHLTKICIASIRYWYPEIPIFLIKDESKGSFNTSSAEKLWNVQVLQTARKEFGWGYGKLEVLFLNNKESFLVIDSDAVLTGPVIDAVRELDADFIVDKEEQPDKRFNEIYYNLERIREFDKDFEYPGYSFNTGQWFGTSTIIQRKDFDKSLVWSDPPRTRDRDIVVNNDQGHLNFVVHSLQQQQVISVARINLMIWPMDGNADFIDIEKIESRSADYPFVIHWAGMSSVRYSELPRKDILDFYRNYYYSRSGILRKITDSFISSYLSIEKRVGHRLSLLSRSK